MFACGGGGGDDNSPVAPEPEQPENILPPPEFIPDPEEPEEIIPPAVDGGELPDIGVDYEEPPIHDGGPNNEVHPSEMKLKGQIVAVKQAADETFFFGVVEHEIGGVIHRSYKEDDLVWFHSVDKYYGSTIVSGFSNEQIKVLPEYTPTFSAERVVNVKEPLCKELMDGGEFCVTLSQTNSDVDIHPHAQGFISSLEGDTVIMNHLAYEVDKVVNEHLIELDKTSVMLFKKANGKHTAVGTYGTGNTGTMIVTVENIDRDRHTATFKSHDGVDINLLNISSAQLPSSKDGDLVYIIGIPNYAKDGYSVAMMSPIEIPEPFM